tara:strand:- start:26168 stop:26992 length:825 start_codon:yes stop_codon:yes gene_type:complete
MKVKHNKKRNTAFLFEALVRELTKSVVNNNKRRTAATKKILSEHFRKGNPLYEEVDCYNSIAGRQGLESDIAKRVLELAKETYDKLDAQEIFKEQSQVIKKINTTLGKSVYDNFVPNYKSFATIAQIFGDKAPIKSRVLMEQNLVQELTSNPDGKEEMKPVDSLVVSSFAKRFNEQYSDMLEEQQKLLGKYIISFGQNEVDFRIHVGTELRRLREAIERSLEMEEVKQDKEMSASTNAVLDQINEMHISDISEKDILKILKLQKLVSEYQSDAD